MDILEKTSKYLGQNIENLRVQKNMSQQQLATLAEIPRSTLTHIESGIGNPSLKNLIKISMSLGVSIEELLSKPRTECLLIESKNIPIQKRSQGNVKIHKLLPEKIKGIEIDKIELAPQAVMGGHPHLEGTKEYLTVIQGEMIVYVAGESYPVKSGDVLAFPGHQAHSYRNTRKSTSLAISVVIPIPVFL